MEKKVTYAEAILVGEIKVLNVFKVLNVPNDPNNPNDLNDPKLPNDLNDPKLLNDPNNPNDLKLPNDLNDPNDLKLTTRRILVAGNRSGGVAVAAMRRWPEAEVVAHAFDYHHARAIRKRLLDTTRGPSASGCWTRDCPRETSAAAPAWAPWGQTPCRPWGQTPCHRRPRNAVRSTRRSS